MLPRPIPPLFVLLFSGVLISAFAATDESDSFRPTGLALGTAGVATPQPKTLSVAAPLMNLANQAATTVKIQHVTLDSASLKTKLPITIPAISAHGSQTVQADFDGALLVPAKAYDLVMEGNYHKGPGPGHVMHFKVHTTVLLPPASPGSHDVGKTQLPPNKVQGGKYPARPPKMEHENLIAPVVPTTPFVAGTPTPTGTTPQAAPRSRGARAAAITFSANNPVGITGAGLNCNGDTLAACAEPSGASGNGVILVSANWSLAYSTDGGANFKLLDPTTIFPADAIGFCCDQIVQYAPSIDRFIWLLQGTSGYRLAMASPADIKSGNGTAWTYWNLTPGLFGKCTSFDYPDLSVGNNALYISWDANTPGTGCTPGFQVARTSLAGIQAGGTITLDYTDPANAPQSKVWGAHLTQNTGDEIFWAGHNGNSKLAVYSLKEGSNTYFWRDVGISSWANNAPTSTTPDNRDWLAKNFNGPGGNSFPRNGIIGAARSDNLLWFGWTAGTDSNFKQAHIEIVTLDRSKDFSRFQQVQVWNNSYGFAYPAFSTNACTGDLGMSFEYGGGGNYENHVVGFWGDFVAYVTTGSDVGTDRFGDYVTIRRAPPTRSDPGNLFTAFGFGLNKQTPPATGNRTDVRYVLFGRPASQCNPIILH